MKYRILTMVGMLALSAGWFLHAQDYDDIYYDASKSANTTTKVVKAGKASKTEVVYGEVPAKYKVAVQSNYSTDRDVDEYNRRGAYDPTNTLSYEVDINGDTIYFDGDSIYDEAFANTRRIERFYNPDIVILSGDDDLVELYYDESPTINLIVGSDYSYASYGWGMSSYYPWYTGWYEPWYIGYGWYSPWRWHSPWHYGYYGWGWGYRPWYYSSWGYYPWYGHWDRPWHGHWYDHNYIGHTTYWNKPYHHNNERYVNRMSGNSARSGYATNRNTRGRVDATGSGRSGIGSRNAAVNNGGSVSRSSGGRTGYATSRGGNMGSRSNGGVTSRSGSASRTPSYNSGSSNSGRSYSGSSSSGRSYSGGSSSSGRSYGGSSSSGSYSGGSRGGSSGGGGSHGGSSGGGSRRH